MLFSSLPIWARRVARGLVGLLLLTLAVLLIAWIALPMWIERQGVRIASERLGRPVTLEAARFAPWRLALTLEGLRIGGPTATAPALLDVQRIEAALSPRSIWHLAPVLSSLSIDAPHLRVAVLSEGHTDLDDLLARLRQDAAPTPAAPAQEPDLALYNIQLRGGEIQIDDRHAGMTHRISDLMLGVPFLSTLDADVDVHVQPRLSGKLNGVVFESDAQAQPFAKTRSATLHLKVEPLDLAAYRAYWPKSLPLRLTRGTIDAQLAIDFQQPTDQPPVLKLSGRATAHQVALQRRAEGGSARNAGQSVDGRSAREAGASSDARPGDSGWDDWLRWDRLSVELADVQPLKRQVQLSSLTWERPELFLGRDAQGRLLLPETAPVPAAAAASAASAAARVPPARTAAAQPRLSVTIEGSSAAETTASSASAIATAARSSDAALTALPAASREAVKALSAASAALAPRPEETAPSAWRFALSRFDLKDGQVRWDDQAVTPSASLALQAIALKGTGLSWPLAKAAPVELSAKLMSTETPTRAAPAASAGKEAKPSDAAAQRRTSATLSAKGRFGADGVMVDWAVREASLGWAASYLQPLTPLRLTGQLSAKGQVRTGPQGQDLQLSWREVELSQLQAQDVQQTVATADAIRLDQAELIPATHRFSAGQLLVQNPRLQLARQQAGVGNWQAWMPPSGGATAEHRDGSPSVPWSAQLAELRVDGGELRLLDGATHVLDDEPARPIGVQELRLRLSGVDWDGQQLRQPMAIDLNVALRRPDATRRSTREAPRLQWTGQMALAPLRLSGQVKADRLPLHWIDPYLDPSIGIHLQRVDGSVKGDFSFALPPAGPSLQANGDLLLSDLRLRQARLQEGRRRSAEDLLSWQALRLNGFKLRMTPARSPDVTIQQASLDEFYARLIINDQGRLNLRDLRQTEQGQAVPAALAASAAAAGRSAATTAALATGGSGQGAVVLQAARDSGSSERSVEDLGERRAGEALVVVAGGSASDARPAEPGATARAAGGASGFPAGNTAPSEPPLRLSIAETRVNAGQVDFNDRFVKPNYSARLSELTGTLGSFTAGSAAMAPLQLRGRVAGTGLLDVSGQLNPSGAPLALDITASATDIELAPLSPYAGKYAGYAIERGKLSSRVHYQIEPGGRLVADNKIVLNQLSFGDRIDSPAATKLPVRLAVALLKDRNGVIDVNLPISGSINDPEFSVGGVIVKLVVSLLTKAVTAPFSLLAGGGAGAEMSQLSFPPGTAQLDLEAAQRLDGMAKVLADKPSLQLSITGWVDPAAERRAAQAAQLEAALVAERRRELRRQQNAAGRDTPSSVAVAASAAASASVASTAGAGKSTRSSGASGAARASSAAGAPASSPEAVAAAGESADAGASADAPNPAASEAASASAPIQLDDAQRQRLLKVVYDNAKLPDKPRNLLGLAKDLPAQEMRRLLMDSYRISDEQMRELALQRSVVVRDALIARGVSNARLFLASPKLHASAASGEPAASEAGAAMEATEGGRDPQAWQPKVDLSLSAQ